MQSYELVITDMTQYGSLFCVAGWDLQHRRMIRPEPAAANDVGEASRFWGSDSVGPKGFAVGHVVHLYATGSAYSHFPHATEDRIVDETVVIKITGKMTHTEIIETVGAKVSTSVPKINHITAIGGLFVNISTANGVMRSKFIIYNERTALNETLSGIIFNPVIGNRFDL